MQKGESHAEQQTSVLRKGRKNNAAVTQSPPTERRTAASLGVSKVGEGNCLRSKQGSLCYFMLQESEYRKYLADKYPKSLNSIEVFGQVPPWYNCNDCTTARMGLVQCV